MKKKLFYLHNEQGCEHLCHFFTWFNTAESGEKVYMVVSSMPASLLSLPSAPCKSLFQAL